MLWKFGERATFEKIAKELKCTRFDLWSFVGEHPFNFTCKHSVVTVGKGNTAKTVNYISDYYSNPLANPDNPECIKLLHELYRDAVIIAPVEYYNTVGWHIADEDDKKYKLINDFGINTQEKRDAILKTGIIGHVSFPRGWDSSPMEVDYAWKKEDHEEVKRKLKEAGWTVMCYSDFKKVWINRKKTDTL